MKLELSMPAPVGATAEVPKLDANDPLAAALEAAPVAFESAASTSASTPASLAANAPSVESPHAATIRRLLDDTTQPLKNGIMLFIGRPGAGKSFEVVRAFQNSFSLLSASNNQHFYDRWRFINPDPAFTEPRRRVILESYAQTDSTQPRPYMTLGSDGLPVAIPQRQTIETWLTGLVRTALAEFNAGKPLTYPNLIIDEFGTFLFRVFHEFSATSVTRSGAPNPLEAYNGIGRWVRGMMDLLRQGVLAGMNVILVAHDKDPDPARDKQGGVFVPSNEVQKLVSADVDATFIRELVDETPVLNMPSAPGAAAPSEERQTMALTIQVQAAKQKRARRLWRVHCSSQWQSKLRGIPDEWFDDIRAMDLIDLVKLAGFAR